MKNKTATVYLAILVLGLNSALYASQSKPWARVGCEGQYLTQLDKQIFKEVAEYAAPCAQHQIRVKKITFPIALTGALASGLAATVYSLKQSVKNKESDLIAKSRLFGSFICGYSFWTLLHNVLPRVVGRTKTVEFEQQQKTIIDNAKKALNLNLQANVQPRPLLGNLCRTKQELAQEVGISPAQGRESIYQEIRSKYDVNQRPLIMLLDTILYRDPILRKCGIQEQPLSFVSGAEDKAWIKNFMKTITRIEDRPRKERTWYQTAWKFTKKRLLFMGDMFWNFL